MARKIPGGDLDFGERKNRPRSPLRKTGIDALIEKRCRPCEGGVAPFAPEKAKEYLALLPDWKLREDGKAIQREYRFKDFKEVIAFFNRIAQIAEEENHHPDLKVGYNRVGVELSTHAVKGLSENDFILAAKFDRAIRQSP